MDILIRDINTQICGVEMTEEVCLCKRCSKEHPKPWDNKCTIVLLMGSTHDGKDVGAQEQTTQQ